jgi:hypothetical protein
MRLLLLLPLLGCAPKQVDLVRPAEPMGIVTAISASAEEGPFVVAPAFAQAISATLVAHNLPPQPISAEAIARPSTTAHRLSWMTAQAGQAPLLCLVEAEVAYHTELAGRYRWTVDLSISLAPAGHPNEALIERFEVPVFLQYRHEGPAAALDASSPVVAARLSELLNRWVSGL